MQKLSKQKLEDIISSGYRLNIGEYIRESWDIFKTFPGGFIGFMIVAGLANQILASIPLVGPIASGIISPIFAAGWLIVAHKISKKERFEFSDFFEGFKMGGDIWLVGIVQGLIFGVIAIVAFAPLGAVLYTGFSGLSGFAGIAAVAGGIAMLYLGISWYFAVPILIFFDTTYWQALEYSRRITAINFWGFVGLVFVFAFLALCGALALVLGLLVAAPVIAITSYTSFANIVHLDEEFEMDIMDHLVDDDY